MFCRDSDELRLLIFSDFMSTKSQSLQHFLFLFFFSSYGPSELFLVLVIFLLCSSKEWEWGVYGGNNVRLPPLPCFEMQKRKMLKNEELLGKADGKFDGTTK